MGWWKYSGPDFCFANLKFLILKVRLGLGEIEGRDRETEIHRDT
jgi:hypothetical protein